MASCAVAFRPDGELLATGCGDEKLRLITPADGAVVREVDGLLIRCSQYSALRVAFRSDPAAAAALVAVGAGAPLAGLAVDELGAWTMVASLILNLDAVLTKG